MVRRIIIDVDTDGDHDLEDAGYVTTVTRAQVTSKALGELMSVLEGSTKEVYEEKNKEPGTVVYVYGAFLALIAFGFCLYVGFSLYLQSKCARFILVRYMISEVVILDLSWAIPKRQSIFFRQLQTSNWGLPSAVLPLDIPRQGCGSCPQHGYRSHPSERLRPSGRRLCQRWRREQRIRWRWEQNQRHGEI